MSEEAWCDWRGWRELWGRLEAAGVKVDAVTQVCVAARIPIYIRTRK